MDLKQTEQSWKKDCYSQAEGLSLGHGNAHLKSEGEVSSMADLLSLQVKTKLFWKLKKMHLINSEGTGGQTG